MKEEIKKFKDTNGNVTYSIKELLYGTHTKLDKINDRLIEGDKTFSAHSTWIRAYQLAFLIVFAVLGYLIFV